MPRIRRRARTIRRRGLTIAADSVACRGRTRRTVSGRTCGGAIARRRCQRHRAAATVRRHRRAERGGAGAGSGHAGAGIAARADTAADGNSFLGRLEANAQQLVRITPVDAPAGNDPSAVIARMNVDAERGDIAAALSDAAQLPDAAKPLAADWVKKAQRPRGRHCGEPADCRRRARGAQQAGRAMIRIALYLIVVGLAAYGIAWLADLPGDVVITWQGMRIETSLMVFGAAVLAAVAILVLCSDADPRHRALAVHAVAVLAPSPRRARLRGDLQRTYRGRRRRRRGGAKACGDGQAHRARRAAGAACCTPSRRSLPATAPKPSACSAPWRAAPTPSRSACTGCSSKRIAATIRRARALMPRKPRAPRRRSAGPSRAVLEARCKRPATGPARSHLLEANARTLAKDIYRRQRAVLLTARAHAVENTDRDSAKAFALEANKLAPSFGAGGGAGRAAACRGRRVAQSAPHHRHAPGAPIRIRNWRRPIASFAPAIPRATGSNASKRWRKEFPTISKARSRSRAPRSMRRNSPRCAPRWRPISRRRPGASLC